jgi:hypothetical protein
MKKAFWVLKTPKNYSENSGCYEVVWEGIFMPFDVICGLDGCPPDNEDYSKYKKTHWWVCPRTKHDVCNVHDISMFIELPRSKEFKKLEDAINYCLDWRKEWLNRELYKADPFGESIKLLRDLADLQNGAPLEQHRKEWEETMEQVYDFLNRWEGQ